MTDTANEIVETCNDPMMGEIKETLEQKAVEESKDIYAPAESDEDPDFNFESINSALAEATYFELPIWKNKLVRQLQNLESAKQYMESIPELQKIAAMQNDTKSTIKDECRHAFSDILNQTRECWETGSKANDVEFAKTIKKYIEETYQSQVHIIENKITPDETKVYITFTLPQTAEVIYCVPLFDSPVTLGKVFTAPSVDEIVVNILYFSPIQMHQVPRDEVDATWLKLDKLFVVDDAEYTIAMVSEETYINDFPSRTIIWTNSSEDGFLKDEFMNHCVAEAVYTDEAKKYTAEEELKAYNELQKQGIEIEMQLKSFNEKFKVNQEFLIEKVAQINERLENEKDEIAKATTSTKTEMYINMVKKNLASIDMSMNNAEAIKAFTMELINIYSNRTSLEWIDNLTNSGTTSRSVRSLYENIVNDEFAKLDTYMKETFNFGIPKFIKGITKDGKLTDTVDKSMSFFLFYLCYVSRRANTGKLDTKARILKERALCCIQNLADVYASLFDISLDESATTNEQCGEIYEKQVSEYAMKLYKDAKFPVR